MWHTDKRGEKHCGEHWSVSQARQVMREHGLASPINEYDVYVALNAFWHDLACVIEDESVLIEAAVAFWFKDEDSVGHSKIWRYLQLKTPISYYGGEAAAEFGNSQFVASS